MIKKIIQYLLIAAAVGSIAYVLYTFYQSDKEYVDSFSGVPDNVNMVMDVHSFSRIGKYEEWLKELIAGDESLGGVSFNPVSEWPAIIASLDSLRTSSEQWQTLLLNSHVVFANSGSLAGNSWIISIGLQDGKSDIIDYVRSFGNTNSPADRSFKNTKIYTTDNYQFAAIGNCFVVAPAPSLIEEAIIKHQNKETLSNDLQFAGVKKMSGKDIPLNFYFALGNEEWMQLDPLFDNGTRFLSGYAVIADTSSNALKLTSDDSDFTIANYLPASTDLLEAFSYEDYNAGWQQQQKLFEGSTSEKFWSQAWKDYGDSCKCDLNELMLDWRAGEWGNAIVATSDSTTGAFRYFKVRDSLDVPQIMGSLLTEHLLHKGVFAIRYPQLFDRNQPQSFLIESNYLTQINDMVFVGKQPQDLLTLKNKTTSLADDPVYMKSVKQLGTNSGRLIYQKDYYVSPLPGALVAMLSSNEFIAASISAFKEDKYLINIALPSSGIVSVQTAPESRDSSVLWNYEHKSGVAQAWSVINHNTNLTEVILQDENNVLNLISSEGKLLWEKNLGNAVIGDIKQIDALKNGKLQYAFTTADGLHIIDRNGNYLTGFPVKPSRKIAGGLEVFDYDKQKNYRLLFSTDNEMIQNYTVKGTPAEGWKYKPAGKALYVDHFKSEGEDQLLVMYSDGSCRLLKRTGEERVAARLKAEGFGGKMFRINVEAELDNCSVVYEDANNNIWTGSIISGSKRKLYESSGVSDVNFAGDVNMDGKTDYALITGNQLKVIDDVGQKIFEVSSETELKNVGPVGSSLSNPLIAASGYSNTVLLYQSGGSLMTGFPKSGRQLLAVSETNGDKKPDYIIVMDRGIRVEN